MERKFKEKREERHMTLREAAERIGVNPSTLQRYESGKVQHVKYDVLVRMAKIYRCEPAELIGWQGNHEPTGHTIKDANSNINYCVDDGVDADLAVSISRPLRLSVKSGVAFIKRTNNYVSGKFYAVRREEGVGISKLVFTNGLTIIDGEDVADNIDIIGVVTGVYYEV